MLFEEIDYTDFSKLQLSVGAVIEAKPNTNARKFAYILCIDFGELGIKTSSAQITDHYTCDSLIGQQVTAVMNFPSKRAARQAIFEYIEVFYNRQRRHSTLDYLSPHEFEVAYSP